MTPESLINNLGGSARVSEATGWAINRINNWKTRGIPSDVFPELIELAKAVGESIGYEQLFAMKDTDTSMVAPPSGEANSGV